MSRTYKDVPWKHRDVENNYDHGRHRVAYVGVSATIGEYTTYWLRDIKGAKRKKKRRVDTKWHWMTTPGWFIKEFMTKPQRAACKQWERSSDTNLTSITGNMLPVYGYWCLISRVWRSGNVKVSDTFVTGSIPVSLTTIRN